MRILDMIKAKKQQFKQTQEKARDNRLLSSVAKRRDYEKIQAKNRTIDENREFVREGRKKDFNNSFLGKVGNRIKTNISQRNQATSKGRRGKVVLQTTGVFKGSGSVFTQQNNSSPYSGSSSGSNPFTLGNRGMYDFSNRSKPKKSKKQRRIIIYQ